LWGLWGCGEVTNSKLKTQNSKLKKPAPRPEASGGIRPERRDQNSKRFFG
jgi:hypothetical protein